MKILVTGSSGLVGSALLQSLTPLTHQGVPLARTNASIGTPRWDPDAGVIDLAGISDIDAVVHLAGDNIARGRWTTTKKARIVASRIDGTRLLAEYFAASQYKPRVMVCASAVGIYGDRGDEEVNERHEHGNDFLADVCTQWENATSPAIKAGIRVVNARLGVVLSAAGGALKTMLCPFKMGLGGRIGSGSQFMSWVSLDDVISMLHFVIANDSIHGPVNFVSPNAVRNREFTNTLGRVLRRPAILPVPGFAARLVFGEMADALLLSSIRVSPTKLIESGYEFHHPDLEYSLQNILKN